MFRNSEVKKITLIFSIIFIALILSSFLITNTIIGSYEKYFIEYNSKVINLIEEKYPDVKDEVINEIINGELNNDPTLLNKYGIKEDLVNKINNISKEYNKVLNTIIIFSISIFLVLIIITYMFLSKLYKKISNLSKYSLDIINSNTTLDIKDDTEGDISILKNRLYDITRMLKENNDVLKKDKVILKDAIADISHQLKTPLTSLYLFNEILREDLSVEDKSMFLDKMNNELNRLEWLVISLLKLSKIEAKAITFKNELIDVRELINSTIESLSNMINSKSIDVTIDGKDDKFYGDFNWMREALINIVKNCIEHSNIKGKININYSSNPIYTEIKIRDNGEGISKEDIRHIFERFYKSKGSSKDSIGIGLSLSKSIIETLNGEISVSSEKNKYTEFIIKIYK